MIFAESNEHPPQSPGGLFTLDSVRLTLSLL